MNLKPVIINFFGGPGTGKSTSAAELFGKMKRLGYKVELVTEYAKDLTYRGSLMQLEDQGYVFAKQHHRIFNVSRGSVDFIITDAPLHLSLVYFDPSKTTVYKESEFVTYVLSVINSYNNINVFITRDTENHPYQTYGRTQTIDQARDIDIKILEMLKNKNIDFVTVPIENSADHVLEIIQKDMYKIE